jgi:hypothetical protein
MITMKDRQHNLSLFRSITGKTTISVKPLTTNPTGYQESRVRVYRKFEGMI